MLTEPAVIRRPAPRLLLVLLFVVALGGGFTLSRVGVVGAFADLDLRVVGFALLVLLAAVWRLQPAWLEAREAIAPSTAVALVLVGYLALTAFWAPPGALLGAALADVAVLAGLVAVTAVLVASDPEGARETLLWATAVAGVVYAVGGLLLGELTVQGRVTFLGGGPNVYGRVVCLGIIAALALAIARRRYLLVGLAAPVMVVAVALSGSRGAVGATVITALVALVAQRRRLRAWLSYRVSRRVALAAAGIIVALGLLAVVLVGSAAWRMLYRRYVTEIFERGDLSTRPTLFGDALEIVADHPVVGGGLGAFPVSPFNSTGLDYPHDLVLEVAATGGLIGVALLVWWVVRVALDARPVACLSLTQGALALCAVLVGVQSLFSGGIYDTRFLWIFTAAALASECDIGHNQATT